MTDKALMMTPEAWPTWPYLTLHGDGRHGLLVDEAPAETGARPKVYLRELHDTCGFDCPAVNYPTFDALIADGWRVTCD